MHKPKKTRKILMDTEMRNAKLDDLDEMNHLLRLSKAYWGYSEEFINEFMAKFSVTTEHLQKLTTILFV
jgi:hypothetical protein